MTQRTGIRTRIAIVFVAMVPFAISACGDSYSTSASGDIEAGAQAATQGTVGAVSVEQAHDQLEKDMAVMVDVREPDEITEQAVPGTIDIPLGQLEARTGEIPKDTPVLVFCRSGNRSQEGAAILAAQGYDASTVEGGILAWQDAGLPTT